MLQMVEPVPAGQYSVITAAGSALGKMLIRVCKVRARAAHYMTHFTSWYIVILLAAMYKQQMEWKTACAQSGPFLGLHCLPDTSSNQCIGHQWVVCMTGPLQCESSQLASFYDFIHAAMPTPGPDSRQGSPIAGVTAICSWDAQSCVVYAFCCCLCTGPWLRLLVLSAVLPRLRRCCSMGKSCVCICMLCVQSWVMMTGRTHNTSTPRHSGTSIYWEREYIRSHTAQQSCRLGSPSLITGRQSIILMQRDGH